MSAPRRGFGLAEKACAEVLIALAIAEDLGDEGDLTAHLTVPESARASARIVARSEGVVCGLPVVALVAERFGLAEGWTAEAEDGDRVAAGSVVGRIEGPARAVLAMERTALNFLQKLSGIATFTARFVATVQGTSARILDTRKTTPGWRSLEKYAVRCGGGRNHRIGLFDGILIKDNHLAFLEAEGGDPIERAISAAKSHSAAKVPVEIEVDTLEQLDRALAFGPDIVLLDNFDAAGLAEAVRRRDAKAPGVLLEASGGVTLSTVAALARTGVDRISVGALTHSATILDFGLDDDVTTR